MYIQDSTLASAFDNAAAEYIEQKEAELLAEYKSISNIANSKKADINLLKNSAAKDYHKFIVEFCKDYKKEYEKSHGEKYPGFVNVFTKIQRDELVKEYKEYLKELFKKKNKVPHAPTKAPGNLNKIILDDETTTILFYCACASLSRKRKGGKQRVKDYCRIANV